MTEDRWWPWWLVVVLSLVALGLAVCHGLGG